MTKVTGHLEAMAGEQHLEKGAEKSRQPHTTVPLAV